MTTPPAELLSFYSGADTLTATPAPVTIWPCPCCGGTMNLTASDVESRLNPVIAEALEDILSADSPEAYTRTIVWRRLANLVRDESNETLRPKGVLSLDAPVTTGKHTRAELLAAEEPDRFAEDRLRALSAALPDEEHREVLRFRLTHTIRAVAEEKGITPSKAQRLWEAIKDVGKK